MTSICVPALSEFAAHVAEGLSGRDGKRLSPRYFYDDLGSALFEAITLLPEYGLTRADERLLQHNATAMVERMGKVGTVAELGSGSGKKTLHILRAAQRLHQGLSYRPIDVSAAALAACQREVGTLCKVAPVCGDWLQGLHNIGQTREERLPLLLLFVGSSIGNLERAELPQFLRSLRDELQTGDFLMVGADLVKDVDTMLAAYDDPTGVTAAFNLNLLGRINRELDTDFDLRGFAHEVRWNSGQRRIEMHLLSCRDQSVCSKALDLTFHFSVGETIWTESSHKFDERELDDLGARSGFTPVATWTDADWPMAEALWRAV